MFVSFRRLAAVLLVCAGLTAPAAAQLRTDSDLGAQWRLNSAARLMAGIQPWYPGHFRFVETDAWKEHNAAMQRVWADLKGGRVATIAAWRDSKISPTCPEGRTLLYPFSGPDFLNAYWLFPDCETILMFGLEHIGEVPDFDALGEADFARLMADVRAATSDLFQRNYFITENMTRQLHTAQLRGVVPLFMLSMALSGVEILRLAPHELPQGGPEPADAGKLRSLRKPRGISIEFRAPGSPAVRRMIYYSVDVADSSMTRYPQFLEFLRRHGQTTTLLKSASYLLHSRQFTKLRNTLLDVSGFIVQDDSGLPYQLLAQRGWQVQLHGTYAVPIPPFQRAFQPALSKAYEAQRPEPLPFSFGYHYHDQRDERSNLLVGRRGSMKGVDARPSNGAMALRVAAAHDGAAPGQAASPGQGAVIRNRRFTTSDGVVLNVLEAGFERGRADTPVIAFVPGWSMPAWLWRAQLAALGRRHPVAALDPRGQGASQVPASGYDLDRRADDIREFVELYPRVVLVGWSLGALEALQYLHRHGEARTEGLVLVDSSIGEDARPPARGGGFRDELRRDRVQALESFLKAIFRKPLPPEDAARLREQALRMPLEASLSLFPVEVPSEHWRSITAAYRKPLLYAVTPQFASQARSLAKHRPATRVEVFRDAGHALFVDEPERFTRALEDFLAAAPTRSAQR